MTSKGLHGNDGRSEEGAAAEASEADPALREAGGEDVDEGAVGDEGDGSDVQASGGTEAEPDPVSASAGQRADGQSESADEASDDVSDVESAYPAADVSESDSIGDGADDDADGSADDEEESGDSGADQGGDENAAADGDQNSDIVPAVDWPELPELEGREALTTTARFRIFADPDDDTQLQETALAWADDLEPTLAEVSERMGRSLQAETASIVFTRAYDARCPARGLAAPGDDPLVMIFVDENTQDVQIQAVMAHELAHLLTFDDGFVGDGVLTEGVANWAAGRHTLAWQGAPDWDSAARTYIRDGSYVSVADTYALNPLDGEDCIARRDRVYNARTAFVSWLIDEVGLETVLAMPVREEVRQAGAEAEVLRLPDYEAAAGGSLTQLERRWLSELFTASDTEVGVEQ